MRALLVLVPVVCLLLSTPPCRAMGAFARSGTPVIAARPQAHIPHDPKAFTQGLFVHQGRLFESTGLYGRSSMRELDPQTGRVLNMDSMAGTYFGEGAAMWNHDILQLTWRSATCFIRSAETLEVRARADFPPSWGDSEGWGLASWGSTLVMSDGSAMLHFLDPTTLERTHSITVLDAGQPVRLLNELDVMGGKVLANVWKSDRVAIIDPASGNVDCWLDLSPLRRELGPQAGVANGLAYDPQTDTLLVTGKYWDRLFTIDPPRCPAGQ